MARLSLLLVYKIIVSLILVVFPFLILPADRIAELTQTAGTPPTIYRLYGMAILALLVGYASAIPTAQKGKTPWGILAMGLVSNGGATAIILTLGESDSSLLIGGIFGTITLLIAVTIIVPSAMLKTLAGRPLYQNKAAG